MQGWCRRGARPPGEPPRGCSCRSICSVWAPCRSTSLCTWPNAGAWAAGKRGAPVPTLLSGWFFTSLMTTHDAMKPAPPVTKIFFGW